MIDVTNLPEHLNLTGKPEGGCCTTEQVSPLLSSNSPDECYYAGKLVRYTLPFMASFLH